LPIKLEVYLDPASQSASGNLYLDDGDTFDYLQGERALSRFWYEPSTHTLMMNQTLGSLDFMIYVTDVNIYGLST
jgi:hypothetical protein